MEAIKIRDISKVIFLNIFTLGFYNVYFLNEIGNDANQVCYGDGKQTRSYLVAWLLNFISLGWYTKYWYFTLGKRLNENSERYGFKMIENGFDLFIWSLVPFAGRYIVATILVENMNKYAQRFNG